MGLTGEARLLLSVHYYGFVFITQVKYRQRCIDGRLDINRWMYGSNRRGTSLALHLLRCALLYSRVNYPGQLVWCELYDMKD